MDATPKEAAFLARLAAELASAETAEDLCLAEIQLILERFGCRLVAVPEALDDQVWTFRVVVERRQEG